MAYREIEMRNCAEWHATATARATVIPAQAGIQASIGARDASDSAHPVPRAWTPFLPDTGLPCVGQRRDRVTTVRDGTWCVTHADTSGAIDAAANEIAGAFQMRVAGAGGV